MRQYPLLIILFFTSFRLSAQYIEDSWSRCFIKNNRIDTQLIIEPLDAYFISKSSVVSIPENLIEDEYSVFTKNAYRNGKLISTVIYDNMKPSTNKNSWIYVWGIGQVNKVADGYWIAHFMNGNIQYKGNYLKGKRIGVWEWYDTSGKIKMLVDYSSNKYKHFDSTGKLVSEYNDDLLTLFVEDKWYSTQKIGDKNIVLYTKNNGPTIDEYIYHFNYNNTYSIDERLMCSMQNGKAKQSYYIIADTLSIENLKNENKAIHYNYKIIKNPNNRITLKLIVQ